MNGGNIFKVIFGIAVLIKEAAFNHSVGALELLSHARIYLTLNSNHDDEVFAYIYIHVTLKGTDCNMRTYRQNLACLYITKRHLTLLILCEIGCVYFIFFRIDYCGCIIIFIDSCTEVALSMKCRIFLLI